MTNVHLSDTINQLINKVKQNNITLIVFSFNFFVHHKYTFSDSFVHPWCSLNNCFADHLNRFLTHQKLIES